MNWFKNVKVRYKILFSFITIALVAVLLGVIGLFTTITLDGITTELKELQHESNSVSSVLNAHFSWRQQLTEAVLTGKEFTGSLDPHTCALGRWYDSDEAKRMNDPELLSLLGKLDEPHAFIHSEAKKINTLIEQGNLEAARNYLETTIFPKTGEVISTLTAMQAQYSQIVEAKDQESASFTNTMEKVNIVLIGIAVVVCVLLAAYIPGLISKPLAALTDFMRRAGRTGDVTILPVDAAAIGKYSQNKDEIGQCIAATAAFIQHITSISQELETVASGDLTTDIELLSENDVMGKSLEHMVNSLNNMFSNIHVSTDQVSSGSKQVADGAQSLAQGSTEQAAAIEELSSSIAEIAQKTKANAEIADKTANLAASIMSNAEKGSRQMDEMMTAVQEINQAGQNISKIIKVIDDIAFQTNILALNAAVEAARAGQHGKGFAVVAEEVRNLASKSAEAAKETGAMIENSIEKAGLGTRIAGETAASLAEIVSGINTSSEYIQEIASSSEEQSLGIDQINTGIDQVAQVVQQNSATAQQSAAASAQMSGQSTVLQDLIAQFRLKSGTALRGLPSAGSKKQEKASLAFEANSRDYGKY